MPRLLDYAPQSTRPTRRRDVLILVVGIVLVVLCLVIPILTFELERYIPVK